MNIIPQIIHVCPNKAKKIISPRLFNEEVELSDKKLSINENIPITNNNIPKENLKGSFNSSSFEIKLHQNNIKNFNLNIY